MQHDGQKSTKLLRVGEFLYLCLAALLFYLLTASRAAEAYTVWQALHPAFIPILFAATSLLFMILFTSEKTTHKLLFVIIHSILIHCLFSIIFPAGDLSGQQMVLGRTRRVFDNTILHGLSGWPNRTIQVFIFEMLKGTNLQAALTTIFARMLNIDILWVHLFFIPVLWGIFVPIASYLVTQALTNNERASILASLLISAFPYATYFGAISVPNSLGFIFFYYSLYFMLKHLSSTDSKAAYWMLAFTFFSFLSHDLTGIMSLSLLLLVVAFKAYKNEKKPRSATTKASLVISFFASVILLPASFIYLGVFGSSASPVFTLEKLSEMPFTEVVGLFFLGELIYNFDIKTILLVLIGPLLALLSMVYLICYRRSQIAKPRPQIYFLLAAFLVFLIDYRIMKLFMSGLPLNEERLWVFQDFVSAPFIAITIYSVTSSLQNYPRTAQATIKSGGSQKSLLRKGNIPRLLGILLALNVLIPAALGGWTTISLNAAYPKIAPLQTTAYELEAVKYIEETTNEKYVVIGDIWTIYAGEVIVGISNPRAYYFGESSRIGHDLFANMSQKPSSQWMLSAMNYTETTVSYFIVTKLRVGTEEYSRITQQAKQNNITICRTLYYPEGEEKLTIFCQEKPTTSQG